MIEMNSILFQTTRFIVLIILQFFLFNNLELFGYSSPYIYILFIITYPIEADRTLLIFLGFLLGLIIDILSNSGGVHAGASVLIAFIRPLLLKFSFGISYEHHNIKLAKSAFKNQIIFLLSIIFIHHFTLFSLENFSINLLVPTFKSSIITTIFTGIIIYSIIVIFGKPSKK